MIEALRSLFPAVALEPVESIDQPTIRVPAANLVEICRALHDRTELGFVLLADITAVDWWPREPRYDVVYHLSSLTQRLRVKVSIDGNATRLPTVQGVWPAAGWLERRTFWLDTGNVRNDIAGDTPKRRREHLELAFAGARTAPD